MRDPAPLSGDAWQQRADLLDRFHEEWNVRHDLRVEALACDRGVRLGLAYPRTGDPFDMREWHTTQRNVGTMRELAQALLAACDFVDAANPEWADRREAS